MDKKFLKKLFSGISSVKDFGSFDLFTHSEITLVRLYAYYLHLKSESNVTLLPKQFINPMFKPIHLKKSERTSIKDFTQKLVEANYVLEDQVYEPMQYSRKGDVVTVFTNLNDNVIRVEFFDKEIEKISLLDNVTFRSVKELENIHLLNINTPDKAFDVEIIGDEKRFNEKFVIFTEEESDMLSGEGDNPVDEGLKISYIPFFHKNEKVFETFIEPYKDFDLFYSGKHWENIPEGFKKNKKINLQKLEIPVLLDRGFICDSKRIVLLTDREILSTLNLQNAKAKSSSKFKKLFDNEVNIGDYVVHEAHGIGKYAGIEKKVVLGEVKDYIVLNYLEEDRLLIPMDQISRVSKYLSADGADPKLTRLGTAEWDNVKKKLKKSVEDIAKDLIEIYAKKSIQKGIKFEEDSAEQIKFEADFGYDLTQDQAKTLNEVKEDMESDKPMDRLIIGDVGFGKTEVALRTALKAVTSGKQVLVIAPTTVLVTQLYKVFSTRLSDLGVKVERVSRFDGPKQNKVNVERASKSEIDILVGTHRLLSKDVKIKHLGLLVVDEEQRFGVKQKERIRQLRANIDVLSMSATPIPRTLQMALTGIKDISIIATPPKGRQAVHTEVVFDEEIGGKVVEEYRRKGQVFIVHNRVESIEGFTSNLKEQIPDSIKVKYAHAQMSPHKLEQLMIDFQERKFDVLVSTTIIENGIDIPTVNTIIIHKAHTFGLSQLYQLRGRVGRADVKAYCYLAVPKVKEFIKLHKNPPKNLKKLRDILDEYEVEDKWITVEAVARVKAILENQELGAGFKIASRDLEIRGSGNVLGSQQSGHINAVGYEMFIRLLEQEIDRIRKVGGIM